MSTIPELTKHARDLMHKAVESTKREFSSIRSGKASTSLLDIVRVEAYGGHVPLNQVAMVAAPEPRLLTVQPFDKSLAQAIEKAIRDSDLGLNPATQGNLIRVPLPALSEERRKDLVKVVHKLGEEGRIAVRHARTDTLSKVKKDEQRPASARSSPWGGTRPHRDHHGWEWALGQGSLTSPATGAPRRDESGAGGGGGVPRGRRGRADAVRVQPGQLATPRR
jgi:ribosome recycling factor